MTYTFREWSALMTRAGQPLTPGGRHSWAAYCHYLAAGVVFSLWLYWFRRNGGL